MAATYDEVLSVAETVYTPGQAKVWMLRANRMLDGRSPVRAIIDGDGDKALAVISALADGAFG